MVRKVLLGSGKVLLESGKVLLGSRKVLSESVKVLLGFRKVLLGSGVPFTIANPPPIPRRQDLWGGVRLGSCRNAMG